MHGVFHAIDVFVALVPEAPTNLQVATQSATSIRVTWDTPQETNGPIVTYKVFFLCTVICTSDVVFLASFVGRFFLLSYFSRLRVVFLEFFGRGKNIKQSIKFQE